MEISNEITGWLKNLNTDKSNPWPDEVTNQAPHKPFLLLSIIDGIKEGWIDSNEIFLSQELVDNFFVYWKGIMGQARTTRIALPFFYMKSEPFWALIYKPDKNEYANAPSLTGLKNRLQFARMNPELYLLIENDKTRSMVQNLIANHYFNSKTAEKVKKLSSLNYDAHKYSEELRKFTNKKFISHYSEEGKIVESTVNQQVRKQGFRKVIRENYNYTCSVCRTKVVTPVESCHVVGAHIIPWNESYNDDPRNGISLCPNHHWLFDEMMMTIRDDFSVKLSPWLKKNNNTWHEYDLISDTKILLPANSQLYPAKEALMYHNDKFENYHRDIDR